MSCVQKLVQIIAIAVAIPFALAISPYQISNNYEYGPTKIENYPHHASLRLASNSKHYCSGAIISERWLLTAAQCAQGNQSIPANIFVVVGVTIVSNDGDQYGVAAIVNHPEYEIAPRKRLNDIAMIKTSENIRMKMSSVLPVALPSFKSHYLIENQIGVIPAVVTGWREYSKGYDPNEGVVVTPVLHMQKSNIRNRRSCRRHLGHINGKMLTDNHLCTVFTEDNICVGDTGSPFMSNDKEIVGIASWHGLTPCGYGYPKVYTYVFSYVQWIYSNMNSL